MEEHYNKLSNEYHNCWFYQEEYENLQLRKVIKYFKPTLDSNANVVDLGGGTGRFSQLLYNNLPLYNNVVCVDPYMKQTDDLYGVIHIQYDTLKFLRLSDDNSYDGFLIKEAIHHMDNVKELFREIKRTGKIGSMVLIITRPKYGIDYPFDQRTRKIWSRNQPNGIYYFELMKRLGFSNCKYRRYSIQVEMSKEEWINMIKRNIWSTFSQLTSEEKENLLDHINRNYSGKFKERMIFISGII